MISRRLFLASTAGLILARPVAAQSVRLPFEHVSGKVFAPVMVNGVPVQAMLDSGSAFYGVDTSFAAKAGVAATGRSITLRGVQKRLSGRRGEIAVLSVGDSTLADVPAVVIDYSNLSATVGRPIEMALGGEFFRQFVVDLDFDDESLLFIAREAFTPPADAVMVPLSVARGLMTAPVQAGGAVLNAIVDTGSEPPLIVSPGPARSLKLFGANTPTAPLSGIGGGGVVKVGTAPALSLGGQAFRDVPVQGVSRSLGADANLGLGLLSQFRVWLDFGGGRMWLKARETVQPFRRDLLGMYGDIGADGIRVSHVSPHSPAFAAGFRTGEVVTQINDMPAAQANPLFRDAAPGTAIRFTLASGATRALTLARYY